MELAIVRHNFRFQTEPNNEIGGLSVLAGNDGTNFRCSSSTSVFAECDLQLP